MNQQPFFLDDSHTGLNDVRKLFSENASIEVTAAAYKKITDCRAYLDKKIDSGNELFYGINTGFGYLQNVKIDNKFGPSTRRISLKRSLSGQGRLQ